MCQNITGRGKSPREGDKKCASAHCLGVHGVLTGQAGRHLGPRSLRKGRGEASLKFRGETPADRLPSLTNKSILWAEALYSYLQ